jgi:tRNA (cytidine32/uridine32-2'-O)-methyltransferase
MSRVQAKDIRVVLVEPSHPGNIGGAARAMKTMGLSDLAIVSPGRFPDPQAIWRAAGAVDVVDGARVFGRVDEAIADCGWVIGTSARSRRVPCSTTSNSPRVVTVTSAGSSNLVSTARRPDADG